MVDNAHMILVVDDDGFQRELIGMQLTNLGRDSLLFAQCGEQALELYDQHREQIQLIISDLSMPDMDGLVLMRHLAQRDLSAALVLISGVSDEILNSAATLASVHGLKLLGVLPKPSAPEHLQALLKRLQVPHAQAASAVNDDILTPERLSAALAADEFIPWYQPKVDLRTGLAVGVEALARWPLANGGMVGPGQFVPALEDAGLADDLFFAMARRVSADMKVWKAKGLVLKTALNLSMDTALNLAMPERLCSTIATAGLYPSDFVIEVTESRLMVERSVAMESLTRLSLMGFTLSIDDFGTGYSSLVQLIDLPFKELKIDGSFVQRASHELKAQTILRVATLLGSSLKMDVIAEGVETPSQADFLRDCGCSLVQGYHFAKPMPFESCTPWLQAHQRPAPPNHG